MRRRDFITLVGGAGISLTRAAWAESSEQMRRVSVLLGLGEDDPETKIRVKEFRLGMRDLGWLEGRNIQIDYRFAGTNRDLINKYVKELIALAPDVIVANSSPVVAALRSATSTIPIVFAVVSNPVGQGFIASLARPGSNITGFSFIEPEMVGKWINVLSEIKPDLSRVGLMFNPDTAPYFDGYIRSFEASSQRTSVEVQAAHVRSVADVDLAIAKLGREPGIGLIAAADPFIIEARGPIIKSADKYRVPTISPYRQFVVEGSLMSYGPDPGDIFRRSSSYVDRILKGELPSNLPAQSPAKFELVVNLKTVKALGLAVPNSFFLLVDELIE